MDYRHRLQRPKGYNDPGHAHELTFSCYHRYHFLSKERTCVWLAEAIRNACTELRFSLWAYVFMPDHVHLIVFPQQHDSTTSRFLSRVKEPVSRRGVDYLRRESPEWLHRIQLQRGTHQVHAFWQPGRGYDRNIDNGRTLLAMLDYVHLNPVRKGLVEQAVEWKWSSAGWFEKRPLNDLAPDPIPYDWLEGT